MAVALWIPGSDISPLFGPNFATVPGTMSSSPANSDRMRSIVMDDPRKDTLLMSSRIRASSTTNRSTNWPNPTDRSATTAGSASPRTPRT